MISHYPVALTNPYLHTLVSVGQQRNEHVDEKDECHD